MSASLKGKGDRGGTAVPSISSGRGSGAVDDLQLGKFGETFLGEFGSNAGLLGAAERDMRGHIEVLVDPDRAGLDPLRDLVGARRIGRPHRRAEAVVGGVGTSDHVL